jgi:hypothetical protein
MSKRTELSQAMARQLVEMRTGILEKGEEFGAELDRELESEDGDGNGDMKRRQLLNEKIADLGFATIKQRRGGLRSME